MTVPRHLACPIDHTALHAVPGGLESAAGRTYPEALGGWDLRPRDDQADTPTGDANNALQADIYDARLGEFSNFDHPHNLMLVHQRQLLEALPLSPGDRVLEIGGHRSGLLAWLERTRGIVGSGVDISPVWVAAQNAAARARSSETTWVLADAEALPFADGSFAAVIAFDVMEHVSRLDAALAACFRVLAPKGRLVVHMPVQDIAGSFDGLQRWLDPADYAARQASVGHFHERMPTRSQMRTRLEGVGFQVLDAHSFNVWVQPLHDHRLLPLLGRIKNRGKAPTVAPTPPAPGAGGAPPQRPPPSGASRFVKAYSRTIVPLAKALSAPDRLGSLLGIGGSCSFVAEKPG
jgi:SAM-dependent methyltransferase